MKKQIYVEIRHVCDLEEQVRKMAKPGNQRRSLLGMLGTEGTFSVMRWLSKRIEKNTHYLSFCCVVMDEKQIKQIPWKK